MSAQAGRAAPSPRRVGLAFGALVFPLFIAVGAPSVALPSVARALGVPFGATAWVLAGWALTSALAMPLYGRFVERWGVRRSLVGAVVLVAAGSALAALAPSLPLLVAGRLVGGIGSGGTLIAAYDAVDEVLGADGRARALGVMAAFGGVASGAGTLIGGALTEWAGWRAVIAVPVVVLLLLPPAARLSPSVGNGGGRIDLFGAALLALFGGALVALLQAHSTGLPAPAALALGAAAVLGAAGLVRRVRRRPDGFVPRRVVEAPGFLAAGVGGMTLFAGYFAALFAAPALLERSTGWGSLGVGAALLPAALFSVVAARAVGALSGRLVAWRITASLGAITAAGLLVGALFADTLVVVAAVALGICGFAGGQAVLVGLAPKLVADEDRAAAQGLFNFLLYAGSSVGPAAVGGLSSAVPLPAALAIVAALPLGGAAASVALRPGESVRRMPQDGEHGKNRKRGQG